MKLVLVNIYPSQSLARYLLSSYVLKAYLDKTFRNNDELATVVLNFSVNEDATKICDAVNAQTPDYVGYSCYIRNIELVLKVVKNLRKDRSVVQIFGGPEISPSMISALGDPSLADYYIIGEGERALASLLRHLVTEAESGDIRIPGVARWNGTSVDYEPDSNHITDLDEIPSVYLTQTLDDRLYARQQAYLETQRGCRFRCTYCVYHKHLSSISLYSQERVLEELDYLIIEKQVMALRIFDAVFTSDLERAKKIVAHLLELKERGIRLPWIYWEFTYNLVDDEFISLVSSLKSHAHILNSGAIPPLDRPQAYSDIVRDYVAINCVGIQSFSQKALKAVRRAGINTEEISTFMEMVKKYNIVLKIDLILGLPFETFDSYFQGLEFLLPFLKNTDHILNIHRLQILPGSDLETMCDTYGISSLHKTPHTVLSTPTFSEQELVHASKLTAILFRVLNSPLRGIFYEAKERAGSSLRGILVDILNDLASSTELGGTQLFKGGYIDDSYWNEDIFREIPSSYLASYFRN